MFCPSPLRLERGEAPWLSPRAALGFKPPLAFIHRSRMNASENWLFSRDCFPKPGTWEKSALTDPLRASRTGVNS